MRFFISGGPGSGCTTTGRLLGERLGIPVFDSDDFFHKPSDPPFQHQYSPEERRVLLGEALKNADDWILSGSVATWGLSWEAPLRAVFLNLSRRVRLPRLENRQRAQFGSRLNPGGDLFDEHRSFMEWAAGYEDRTEGGRSLKTDREFVKSHCESFLEITEEVPLEEVVEKALTFFGE